MRVFEVGFPVRLTEVSFFNSYPNYVEDLVINGQKAYIAANNDGLDVLDITQPITPTLINSFNLPTYENAIHLDVDSDRAYVQSGYYGVRIVDITDPQNLTELGNFVPPSSYLYAVDINVKNSMIYIADLDATAPSNRFLRIIDASIPTNLIEKSTTPLLGQPATVSVVENNAFIGTSLGLEILNITNPYSPTITGNFPLPGFSNGVQIVNELAYVADGSSGLQIVDISDPSAPYEIGSMDTPGFATDVVVSGTYAYVADREGGLRVIDVSNPSSPQEVGFHLLPKQAITVSSVENLIYVANQDLGLYIFQFQSNSQTYSISGRVTDVDDTPMQGVVVWAGFPYNSSTNYDGYYFIDDIPPGTYSVHAQKEGVAFYPNVTTVNLPPSKSSVDFVGTQAEIYPIIFLPGIMGSRLYRALNLALECFPYPNPEGEIWLKSTQIISWRS